MSSIKMSVSVDAKIMVIAQQIAGTESASAVVQAALKEYVQNHKSEIDTNKLVEMLLA